MRYLRAIYRDNSNTVAAITTYRIVVSVALLEVSTMLSAGSDFPHSGGIIISKKFIMFNLLRLVILSVL